MSKLPNPKTQLLKGATRIQRSMIDLLVSRGTLKAAELSFKEIAVMRRLHQLGATVIDPSTGTWYLSQAWNQVLEANAPLPPEITQVPLPKFKTRPEPEPDAPRTWKRPPAIYSNITAEDRINQILNS